MTRSRSQAVTETAVRGAFPNPMKPAESLNHRFDPPESGNQQGWAYAPAAAPIAVCRSLQVGQAHRHRQHQVTSGRVRLQPRVSSSHRGETSDSCSLTYLLKLTSQRRLAPPATYGHAVGPAVDGLAHRADTSRRSYGPAVPRGAAATSTLDR